MVHNVGVSLLIVTAVFAGTRPVAGTTTIALFQTIVMALVAAAWGRMAESPQSQTDGTISGAAS